jgi:hypothetical protein
LQHNKKEAAKMAVKEERAKKIKQSTVKAKSKMSKAEKKAAKKQRAQEFETLNAATKI